MTGTELDDILADNGSQEQEQTQETATTETVNRDEHGRFAPKAGEPEVTAEQQVEGAEEPAGNIPPAALAASRQKAREKEQEADQLRTQLAELRGQVDVLTRQTRQPQVAPKVEEPKPTPEIWEDPNGFVQAALTPVQQAMQQQAERFSMRLAVKEHGKETVQAAYAALGQAIQAGDPSARAEYQRIKASDDPYEDIVQWHKRSQTLQKVGDDPDAWLEAEMEKRLADPAYQGKILERIQATASQNANRSNPNVKLPPSLTRLPAGGNAGAEADMSDAGLFSHATR